MPKQPQHSGADACRVGYPSFGCKIQRISSYTFTPVSLAANLSWSDSRPPTNEFQIMIWTVSTERLAAAVTLGDMMSSQPSTRYVGHVDGDKYYGRHRYANKRSSKREADRGIEQPARIFDSRDAGLRERRRSPGWGTAWATSPPPSPHPNQRCGQPRHEVRAGRASVNRGLTADGTTAEPSESACCNEQNDTDNGQPD